MSAVLGAFRLPALATEKFTTYEPASQDRTELSKAVDQLKNAPARDIRPVVNGEPVPSDHSFDQLSPFNQQHVLARVQGASATTVQEAIKGALAAKAEWLAMPLHQRAAVFYRAAYLFQNDYKYQMMAATMLGQGKNAYQADIDCIAESIDFLRTFPTLAERMYQEQPPFNAPGVWNRSEVRPLDGFVYAICPFNFTALAVNLVLAPLIVGNVVVWKPSPGAVLSSWLFNEIMIEAGMPPGVMQFIPGDAEAITKVVLANKHLSAVHFTGSTDVFQKIYASVGSNITSYVSYPRMIGETSGKNFHLIHKSANIRNAALKTIRASFEYQGQKCSACSRAYVPRSCADEFFETLAAETKQLTMGDNFTDFCGPVISKAAYQRVSGFISRAIKDETVEIIAGGECDDSMGLYIRPTVLKVKDASSPFLSEEIFGPVLAVHVYEDESFGPELYKTIDECSPFALTGAIFAKDRRVVADAIEHLRFSAGNFYINDQCTGAMPGHQPFGGSRASGTNDKAGTFTLLQRFVSARTIKENFGTIDTVLYPSNLE
ncbi:uncharacterized protein LTR77_004016 [Saxophila tyrrhenica]|uniref:Multifunctional fusion protein n=1 Tax=Saxophila tyrrhenica TaxID=1690608 RepID=A0AAV9PJB2_9PEZI|nr:hypothetical protein LTR77_004016 [Saxophila tyrrhenica]